MFQKGGDVGKILKPNVPSTARPKNIRYLEVTKGGNCGFEKKGTSPLRQLGFSLKKKISL